MEVQQSQAVPLAEPHVNDEAYLEETTRELNFDQFITKCKNIQSNSTTSSGSLSTTSDLTSPKLKLSENDCMYIGETLGKALSCSLAEITMKRPSHPVALLAHYLLVFKYEAKFDNLKKDDIEHLVQMREQHFVQENEIKKKLEEFEEEGKNLETGIKKDKFIFEFYGEVKLRKGRRVEKVVNHICEKLIVDTQIYSLIKKIRKEYIIKDLKKMLVILKNFVLMEKTSIAKDEISAFYGNIANILKLPFPNINNAVAREQSIKHESEMLLQESEMHSVSDTELHKFRTTLSTGFIPASKPKSNNNVPCMYDLKKSMYKCQFVTNENDAEKKLFDGREASSNKIRDRIIGDERNKLVEAIRKTYYRPGGLNQSKEKLILINDLKEDDMEYVKHKVSEVIQEMETHIYQIRVKQMDHIKQELSNILKNLLEELYDIRMIDKSEDNDYLEEEAIPLLNNTLDFQYKDDKFIALKNLTFYIRNVLDKQKEDMKRANEENKVLAEKELRNLLDSYFRASVILGRSFQPLLLEHEQNRCSCPLETSSLTWMDDEEGEMKAATKIEFENILTKIITDIDTLRVNKSVLKNIELITDVLIENGGKPEKTSQTLYDIYCLQRLCQDLFKEEASSTEMMDSMPRGRPCACLYLQHVVSMLVEIFDSENKKYSLRREKEKKELQREIIKMFNSMVTIPKSMGLN